MDNIQDSMQVFNVTNFKDKTYDHIRFHRRGMAWWKNPKECFMYLARFLLYGYDWEIDGETVETVSDFIFLGSKITADGICSHEIKKCLLLGRKVMSNLDSIFKSRDITLPTNVRLVKAMVFPVVMYGCESWTVKKAECRRIDAFELWCWKRLLRVPWTVRRSNQSILKEISPGISLEGMMLKLKLQYFGHLMWRLDSLEKTVMLGGIGGRRRRGRQRMRWLDGITDSMDMSLGGTPGVGDGQGGLACCDSWGRKELDTTEQLNWTEWFELWYCHRNKLGMITNDKLSIDTSAGGKICVQLRSFLRKTHLSKKKQNINCKRYMHPNVHSSSIYNCQVMEGT